MLRELLPLAPEAQRVYERNIGGGILTTDLDFRVCKYQANCGGQLWHLPNEVGGIAMMLPGDY